MRELYLDDLRVGQRFVSDLHALDEAQVIAFASQFDPQPFHLNDAAAKDTLFGGLVGAGAEISWPQPTRPDDVLRVESEILEITPSRSRPDRGMVKVRSETRNQRGEVVQILEARLVVPRRPSTADSG